MGKDSPGHHVTMIGHRASPTEAPLGTRVLAAGHGLWARRVRWRGFLRRQRAATLVAWLALIAPILVVFGLQGPEIRLVVIQQFSVRPWPVVCLFGALAVALLCTGSGSSVLPRRAAWPAVGLAAGGVVATAPFIVYLDGGRLAVALEIGLAISIVVLAVGLAFRRGGWGMAGFAASFGMLAGLVMVLLLPGLRTPTIGSPAWSLGLATHQLTYGLGYLVFLATTLTAPIGLLTGTAGQSRRAHDWLDSPRFRAAWLIGCGLCGVALLAWLTMSAGLSAGVWVVAATAAAAVIVALHWTARHPLIDRDERFAGWWIAGTVTLPYALLVPALLGASPDRVFAAGWSASRWSWLVLLVGAAGLWVYRRQVTAGVALLSAVTLLESMHRFAHLIPDVRATVCLLVLTIVGWEVALRRGWRQERPGGVDARARVALLRTSVLALLIVGILGLVPDGTATQALFGVGVVVGSVGSLLLDQPGRDLSIPFRGAAYVRAAGWTVVVVAAQGVMVAANGVDIANGSQGEAATLLTLPLLILYAGFRRSAPAGRAVTNSAPTRGLTDGSG